MVAAAFVLIISYIIFSYYGFQTAYLDYALIVSIPSFVVGFILRIISIIRIKEEENGGK